MSLLTFEPTSSRPNLAESMPETLYLIDAPSLIYQVFHALPPMSASDGTPTSAVFGFTRDLLYLREEKKPDYLICAFDPSGPTFRDEMYSEYKATRSAMPDDLRLQWRAIDEVLEALGVLRAEVPGFEADDVIATIARRAAERGIRTFIGSGDKDCRQLLTPGIAIYNIRKDEVFDEAALQRDWGIRPDQVVDLLAMVGDSIDNIPGMAGVGPKTAAALLAEHGTLEGVLANVDRISGTKRQENVRRGAAVARRGQTLVALRSDVPIEIDWEAARVRPPDAPRLAALFRRFGFRRLEAQFAAAPEPAARSDATYHLVNDPEQFGSLCRQLAAEPAFALHVERATGRPAAQEIVGVAVAWKPGEAWYVPMRGPAGERHVEASEVLEGLRPLLESPTPRKLAHDLKRQALVLRRSGVRLAGLAVDTMIADYLMEAGERSHSLDQLAQRYLGHTLTDRAALVGKGSNEVPADQVPIAAVAAHAGERADVSLRLSAELEHKLREICLWSLYETLERPLVSVLIEMEHHGIALDVPLLDRLAREFAAKLAEIEERIYASAGRPFNIASPIQLRQVLFDELRLPVLKRTKTGPSTDQEVLEGLAAQHSLPALLIEHRQIAKLKGTYVDALPKLVHPHTGRLHASFNQVVAATGRLSSSDPNLQNIPIRTEQGRQIRQAFIPRSGQRTTEERARAGAAGTAGTSQAWEWRLLTADYSQVELRILAHFSQDEALCRAFAGDEDIHSVVAAQIFRVDAAAVSPAMRRTAKTVNFGVIYGLSPFGLATRLGIPQEAAAAFIRAYFEKYCGVEAFIQQVLGEACRQGWVGTILGRRRRISGVRPAAKFPLNQPEREAVNTVVQGSAADLIKKAMIDLDARLRAGRLETRMLLQIHDELVLEGPAHEMDRVAPLVVAAMTGALELRVPLKVDVAVGANWLDVEPLAG